MLAGDSVVLSAFIWVVIILISLLFYAFGVQRLVKHYLHYPIPAFAVRFIDNPIRRLVQPPKEVVDWMQIEEGMHILEIGPGPGTFTFEACRRSGESGRLITIDIQPSVASRLDRRLRARGVENVSTAISSADRLPFCDNTFDRVFMVTVLGEIPDKKEALLEVRRVLTHGGLLAIGELLADPDYPRKRSVSRWCHNAGLEPVSIHGSVMHYLLTFKK